VTVTQLKAITVIQNNVDAGALEPYLSIAEDLHIRPILGEDLYQNFRQAFDSNSLSPMYETMLAFITPTMSYYAFYEYLPFSLVKVTNKGLEKKIGNNSESVSIQELTFLRNAVLSYAKAYAKELQDWLENNKEAFLPFGSCNSVIGEPEFRSGRRSVGGVFFPRY
jgi:hypothetical protein